MEKLNLPESVLTQHQKIVTEWREYRTDYGTTERIRAKIRYDDSCGNGHNTFTIIADGEEKTRGGWRESFGGCCHDEIVKHFPEYAHLIKWHLVNSDGPTHYLSNTIYLAGNRDYNGLLKGEPNHRHDRTVLKFNGVPIAHELDSTFTAWLMSLKGDYAGLEIIEELHPQDPKTYSPNYTVTGYQKKNEKAWYGCPFSNIRQAQEYVEALKTCKVEFVTIVTSWGAGKERELDAARSCAVWPEATDEELCLPAEELRIKLIERLPVLMVSFKSDIESLGFVY